MDETIGRSPRRTRIGVVVLVLMIHVVAILALLRALAPDFSARTVDEVLSTFTVAITAPPPPPPPPTAPHADQGAAAPAGIKAKAAATTAPRARIPLPLPSAPQAASTGSAATSGASAAGAGTGGGGNGSGSGSGGTGDGTGGGAVTRVQKTAGEINSARDFPRETRDLRLNDFVIVAMTVGTDGRASNCHVVRASRDPQADAITCRLAEKRFRFRPAMDSQGRPVSSVFGWAQRWFL